MMRDRMRTERGPQHLIHAHSAHPLPCRALLLLCSSSRSLLPNFKAKFKGVVFTNGSDLEISAYNLGGAVDGHLLVLTSWQAQGQEIRGYPANSPLTCLLKS